jgi:hypothetical protein
MNTVNVEINPGAPETEAGIYRYHIETGWRGGKRHAKHIADEFKMDLVGR